MWQGIQLYPFLPKTNLISLWISWMVSGLNYEFGLDIKCIIPSRTEIEHNLIQLSQMFSMARTSKKYSTKKKTPQEAKQSNGKAATRCNIIFLFFFKESKLCHHEINA